MNTTRYIFLFCTMLATAMTATAQPLHRMEYFLDTDPGYGQARAVSGINAGDNSLTFDVSDATVGAHVLNLRVQDNNGLWSFVYVRPLYVFSSPPDMTGIEYFFDTDDPGEGKAIQVSVQNENSGVYVFDVSTTDLDAGDHQLNVRLQLSNGLWTRCSIEPFTVSQATGVKTIEMTMPLSIRVSETSCSITAGSRKRGDSRIEVYDAAGHLLGVGSWVAGSARYEIPLSLSRNSVVMVRVTDIQYGHTVVRRQLVE